MGLSVKSHRANPPTLIWTISLIALTMMTLPKSVDSSHDSLFLCMKNCEQCESMYGAYFEGNIHLPILSAVFLEICRGTYFFKIRNHAGLLTFVAVVVAVV